jgi:DNA helicase HerA-like ATPase
MNRLNVGERFSLPIDFVTETQAILAMRRVGKTYTASVEAEELLKLNQQIVVIDPTGAWWGLKSSADGRSPGFSIPVFGGEHADVPLEEGAGAVIANALIEHRFSAILDVSLLRKNAMKRFATAFLEELYHKNREALHLFMDEADLFAPQKPFKGDEQVLGAMEDIVRRGGVRGIGCTLITQRPSVLNKDVLTQCGILVTLRMSHPHDIAPIDEWVREHGDEARLKEMRGSLSTLPKGTGWFWGPGLDIFSKVSIRARDVQLFGDTKARGAYS